MWWYFWWLDVGFVGPWQSRWGKANWWLALGSLQPGQRFNLVVVPLGSRDCRCVAGRVTGTDVDVVEGGVCCC